MIERLFELGLGIVVLILVGILCLMTLPAEYVPVVAAIWTLILGALLMKTFWPRTGA